MRFLTAPWALVALVMRRSLVGISRHPWRTSAAIVGAFVALIIVGFALTLEGLPTVSVQRGFRGTGMIQYYKPNLLKKEIAANTLLPALPAVPPAGKTAAVAYRNIQVLGDADANAFLRLMGAFPNWLSPATGCAYCHSLRNMADDALYTKTVARHMIEMTREINTKWKSHVGNVGVTCYTCHRGHGVPQEVWFAEPPPGSGHNVADAGTGQGGVGKASGLTTLASDPFMPFLLNAQPIRITGNTALPSGNNSSTKQAEWTYGLMMHFGHSLGVGCTYCHNTRDFSSWDQGTPQRLTAWYGIQMVRDINRTFMVPLTPVFPAARLGPTGDVAKINCATCHQGAYKPFYGASDLGNYPLLAEKPSKYLTAAGAAP
ncbi:photosynthetic reaction center cytochrome PufC [Lichenicola sp.]|uniref:photosynthetic reaction center cytochrome PufC n=1 Tax=Lichenicola sp. TaxID=2804529 RepID=UPI003B007586